METLLVLPATVAEIGLLLYLLVVGVRTSAARPAMPQPAVVG
ncbi:hypothetical protein ACFO3K_13665 [Cellulomonas algicola]|uniref:Uncharacterized protein n=1 Tax=Cellulomonas algicola TaxID=2071633 RepID=A0A401UWG1_9CELL|nr:hypothetical protein [Cellulomonas algicola]GCD19023.1 hypothetical protein CTKZ_05850 [Cellulomonas algicola]